MKFLELLQGTIINVDKIKSFEFEILKNRDDKEILRSFVHDDLGNKYEFLELPTGFIIEGKKCPINPSFISILHKLAINEIMKAPDNSLIVHSALHERIFNMIGEKLGVL